MVLKEDHQKVRKLFGEFKAAGENATATKGKLAKRIIEELTVHTYLENEVGDHTKTRKPDPSIM